MLKQVQETTKKDEKIARLTNVCEYIVKHIDEIISCRPPSRVYALYLKEYGINFRLNVASLR
jgi:hypothetical protein